MVGNLLGIVDFVEERRVREHAIRRLVRHHARHRLAFRFGNVPLRGCGGDDLFLAHSKNGVHWEGFAQPLLRHEDRDWTRKALYRGSFLYDSDHDELAVWFSARSEAGIWRMGYGQFRYQSLLAQLSRAPANFARIADLPDREVWTEAP